MTFVINVRGSPRPAAHPFACGRTMNVRSLAMMKPGPSRGKALVAEEEDEVRSQVGSVLRSVGFEVVEVCAGQEAYQRVRGGEVDLAVLGGLSGMSAREIVRR